MDLRFIHLLPFVVLVWPDLLGAIAPDSPEYTVEVSLDTERLRVNACFPGTRPRALFARDERAGRHLKAVFGQYYIDERRLDRMRERNVLSGLGSDGCVAYVVAVGAAARNDRRSLAMRVRNGLLLSPHLFLWYPDAGSVDLEVRFKLPSDLRVSAPWQRIGGTQQAPVYRTGSRPASWDARIAIGSFQSEQIRLPGGTLEVALLDADPPVEPVSTMAFIEQDGELYLQGDFGSYRRIESSGPMQ